MLGLAKRTGAPIFQASTSEVYGDPLVHPQTEDYWGNVNPIGLRACYDEGKRCAETLFFDYQRQYDLPIRVARIFNTYGPRLSGGDGRVVSNFVLQALGDQPITIFGKGQQTRSFCFVSDTVDAIILMMEADDRAVGPINVGNPVETTILELAETVLQMTKSKSKLVFQDLPSDDPKRRLPDIRKAATLLDWSPKVSLEDGLAETIKYFRDLP